MSSSPKKILILGVGSAQADALRCCKELGLETHAISYKREGPGLEVADHFEVINITDKEQVLAHAKSIACDAVYSVGSDIAMPTVGYVAETLGLPCPVPEAIAELLNHKGRFRKLLAENELWPLRHQVVEVGADGAGWSYFPAIVKPVDSQGGRGVATAQCSEDLPPLIENAVSFSRSGQAIIEEYVTGPEFSINAFMCGGDLAFACLSDRFVDMAYPCGVVIGHGVPARIPETVQENAIKSAVAIAKAVGLKDGPAYFQMKHVGDDVYVIEATPRLDGCHVWRLVKHMYGVDLLEAALRVALGEQVVLPGKPEQKYKDLHLDFFTQKPNTPFHLQESDEKALFEEWYYGEGEAVRPINGYAEKTGYQIRQA